jgi:hypothetical protein
MCVCMYVYVSLIIFVCVSCMLAVSAGDSGGGTARVLLKAAEKLSRGAHLLNQVCGCGCGCVDVCANAGSWLNVIM